MMLRVVLFEVYKHYRLRLAPGATVTKNTIVTTKPAAVPITRLPRVPEETPAVAGRVAQRLGRSRPDRRAQSGESRRRSPRRAATVIS